MKSNRVLACAFAFCSLATLLLLVAHPGADAGRLRDGVVHGGFIVISAVLLVCFTYLSRMLGSGRVLVTAGFVLYCVGTSALMASMFIDGLLLPAVLSRPLADPSGAQPLLLLCGTAIGLLMPLGLLFQAAAVLCYSIVVVRVGRVGVGVVGLSVAAVMLTPPVLLPALSGHVLMAGIAFLCGWYLGLAHSLGFTMPSRD